MKRLFLLLGIVLIIVLLSGLFFIKVRSVTCTTQDKNVCPNQTNTALSLLKGSRLLGAEKRARAILSSKAEVKDFKIQTSILGDISVSITLREASIALKPDSSDTYTLYTKDGIVVREDKNTTLPFITLKEQIPSESVPFVVQLGFELTTMLPTKELVIEGSSLKVVLRDDRMLYYPLSGDLDLLLGSTIATFSQLNLSDGKLIIDRKATTIREIDLRFKNPVLR